MGARARGLLLALVALGGCVSPQAPAAGTRADAGTVAAHGVAPDAGAARAPAAFPDDLVVAELGDAYLKLLERISPESATPLGLHARDADLDARDQATFAEETALERALLADIDARFPEGAPATWATSRLSPGGRTDLALLRGMLRTELLRREQRPLETAPQIYTSPMGAIFSMTARDYAPGPVRAAAVVARLEKIPPMLAEARKNLAAPPKVWTQIAIERSQRARGFFAAQRAFLEKHLPAELARVHKALEGATVAYVEYAGFLEKTVLPRSTGTFAAGNTYFSALLREGAFVTETPDALEAMGRKVFGETEVRMNEVAKRLDPKAKGWPEVVARVKRHHPKQEELLDAYRFEVKRARDFLAQHDVVPFPEGDDLSIVDTPEFMRTTVIAAYDQPPPFDAAASTKGFFFVTPVDPKLSPQKREQMLRENDHGDIVDTAVHEAYPGHHLQLSFAAKHPSKVRKAYDPPIFSEGWALYAEELMAELGYYTDEERLMQLEWTLVRAARIVLDVGLHTKGMSFAAAVAFLTDKVHLEPALAVSEVKRYTMSPTQPLAYLTGREAIFAIRARYKAREQGAYSLKRFHKELLERGTLPPGLLAKELLGE